MPGATDGGDAAARVRAGAAAARSGASGDAQQPRLDRARPAQSRCDVARASGHIRANGFSSRCLRARSRRTAPSFARVDQQVEAAEALDRDDARRARIAVGRAAQRVVASRQRRARSRPTARAAGRRPGRRWAGRGSGGRAGSSYSRGTPGTSRSARIVVSRAVVGQRVDDAEARAAVRAVGERIAVAAVGGIEDLGQAVRAGREVGQRPARDFSPPVLARISKPA